MTETLTGDARQHALATLPDWAEVQDRDAIFRHYQFGDFQQAFAFMTMVALAAEKSDHHPEWYNVYNRVEVMLSTHDAGGLTDRDITLARFMDRAARQITGSI